MELNIKDIVTGVSIAVLSGVLIGGFNKTNNIEKQIAVISNKCEINSQEILVVKKSRENLSDYYVTRREFNSYMKDFEKKVDQQDNKLEKILDILIQIKK